MCKNVPEHRPQAGMGMEDGLISGQPNRKVEELLVQSCPVFVTPWMVAHQAPLSMGFSRQEYWSR